MLKLKGLRIDGGNGAQIDRTHFGAVRVLPCRKRLTAANLAEAMRDVVGVEFVGRQGILAAREGEFVRWEEAQQWTFLPTDRAIAAQCLRRNLSPSTLNVTAPQ